MRPKQPLLPLFFLPFGGKKQMGGIFGSPFLARSGFFQAA
jgi:hypothetical protein